MNNFSVQLTIPEITLLRQSLDVITITGKDAKFVANLQTQLDQSLLDIQSQLQTEKLTKELKLQNIVVHEAKKQKTSQ